MAIETIGALRGFIFDGVEEGAVVGGPGGAGDAFEPFGQKGASAQVFDVQRVLAKTGRVGRVSEKTVVVANNERIEAEKGVALSKFVQIKQRFFRCSFGVHAAAMDRV